MVPWISHTPQPCWWSKWVKIGIWKNTIFYLFCPKKYLFWTPKYIPKKINPFFLESKYISKSQEKNFFGSEISAENLHPLRPVECFQQLFFPRSAYLACRNFCHLKNFFLSRNIPKSVQKNFFYPGTKIRNFMDMFWGGIRSPPPIFS